VIFLSPFRRAALLACAAAALLPTAVAAQGPTAMIVPLTPNSHDLARISLSGNYLAARHAGLQRDIGASAAYYRAALKADPKNNELLERAFLAIVADGELDEAVKLAERLVQVDRTHRIARLVLGVPPSSKSNTRRRRRSLPSRCAVRSPILPPPC